MTANAWAQKKLDQMLPGAKVEPTPTLGHDFWTVHRLPRARLLLTRAHDPRRAGGVVGEV
jgi:hypothetical protein